MTPKPNKNRDVMDAKVTAFEAAITIFCRQIDKIVDLENVGLCSFILTLCLIDTASAYCSDKQNNQDRFEEFVQKYLGQVNAEYAEEKTATKIYTLRCTLVHSFTITNGVLLSEMKNNSDHLKKDQYGNLVIDLKSFYQDCKIAVTKHLSKDLKGNAHVRKIFSKQYKPPFDVFSAVAGLSSLFSNSSGNTSLSEMYTFYRQRKLS